MPLFALFNAGVVISGASLLDNLTTSITVGIVCGLFFGKPLGIFLFSWIASKLRLASLPTQITWPQFFGMSMLAGIGFTMSLFIASLAYENSISYLNEAKIGIIIGSLFSAIAGLLYLRRVLPAAVASTGDSTIDNTVSVFPDTLPEIEEYPERDGH